MWDLEKRKAEIDKNSHDECEDELPLHPKTYLVLGAFPEAEYILLSVLRNNNTEKIFNAGFEHGKIKREYDNDNKRKETSKDVRYGAEGIRKRVRHIK